MRERGGDGATRRTTHDAGLRDLVPLPGGARGGLNYQKILDKGCTNVQPFFIVYHKSILIIAKM